MSSSFGRIAKKLAAAFALFVASTSQSSSQSEATLGEAIRFIQLRASSCGEFFNNWSYNHKGSIVKEFRTNMVSFKSGSRLQWDEFDRVVNTVRRSDETRNYRTLWIPLGQLDPGMVSVSERAITLQCASSLCILEKVSESGEQSEDQVADVSLSMCTTEDAQRVGRAFVRAIELSGGQRSKF